MSQQEEHNRDLELQREVEQAFEEFLNSNEADRLKARLHHIKLLKAFAARINERWPRPRLASPKLPV